MRRALLYRRRRRRKKKSGSFFLQCGVLPINLGRKGEKEGSLIAPIGGTGFFFAGGKAANRTWSLLSREGEEKKKNGGRK